MIRSSSPVDDADLHEGGEVVERHGGELARAPHRGERLGTMNGDGPAGAGLVDVLGGHELHDASDLRSGA